MIHTMTWPIRVVSAANARECWQARARRVKRERGQMRLMMRACFGDGAKWEPLEGVRLFVTLVRIAPRMLDKHDGLPFAFKGHVDGIADWLGLDDADTRLVWMYRQERAGVRQYALRVELHHSVPRDEAAFCRDVEEALGP